MSAVKPGNNAGDKEPYIIILRLAQKMYSPIIERDT